MEARAKRIRLWRTQRAAQRQCSAFELSRDPYHTLIAEPGFFASSVKIHRGTGWKQGAIVVQPLESLRARMRVSALAAPSGERPCTAGLTGGRRMWQSVQQSRRAGSRGARSGGHRPRIFWASLKALS